MSRSAFTFEPSPHVPFRDTAEIARCRAIKRAEIDQHANPDFKIRVIKDDELLFIWVSDMLARIRETRDAGKPLVMLLPNPWPGYRLLAGLINAARLDCQHVHLFAMDEYANEHGVAAPEDWPNGFLHAMLAFLWSEIDEDLRPPRAQVHGPNENNADHYLDLMNDAGGLDISYTGPGWTGHLAFVEPDAPEFAAASPGAATDLDEWKQMGCRVVTLSPFTLAQNSLHGCFGYSGDLSAVPPKGITIGPKEVIAARHRWEMAGITVAGSATSWQRLTARLCYHGPVTPKLPSSIHQTLRTDCYITEAIAADIEPTWDVGY